MEEIVTTQVAEGGGTETPSQETTPGTQVPASPQDATQAQVGSTVQSPTSPQAERPKASEYYGARQREKSRLSAMEYELRQLREQLKNNGSQNQQPSAQPKSKRIHEMSEKELEALYFENPGAYARRVAKEAHEQIEEYKQEIREKDLPTLLSQRDRAQENERSGQEALELLFPKDIKNPNSDLRTRMGSNPQRIQRIGEIETEFGLNAKDPRTGISFSDQFPLKAAKIIAKELQADDAAKVAPPNPAAPKKAQMVSTATGIAHSNGGGKPMTLDEIKARRLQLQKQEESNPSLRYDDKVIAEKKLLRDELDKRFTELKGQ